MLSIKFFIPILLSWGIFTNSESAVAPSTYSNASKIETTNSTVYYALPFRAEDLKAKERIFTGNHAAGVQGEGEDFGMRRYLGNQKWTRLKDGKNGSKNSDYLIYGQPIYAIGDGTIVGCWCNAPENPKPGASHAEKKKIPGGGNMLWVDHPNGTRVLYAHLIPGTIPNSLCANKDKLFPKPKSPDNPEKNYVMLPAHKQVKIKKGQFLGKVGNSGSSTGPHLHLHMQKSGKAVKMHFERGLYKMQENADLNGWKSFSKKEIPDGRVLIWPPRRLSKEYARHGFPIEKYQRLFDHLSNSGFEPEWIDAYRVGNKTYLNFIWRPAKNKWRSYFGLSGVDYQTQMTRAKNDGYVPYQVESYNGGNQVRYCVIFRKGSATWEARHGLNSQEHQAKFEQFRAAGFAPVNVSVTSVNNKRYYTVLYKKNQGLGKWYLKSKLDDAAYQAAVDQNKKEGRKPRYLNVYKHNGKRYYTAIFSEKPNKAWKARHGQSSSNYQNEWKSATSSGFLTKAVSGTDGADSNHRFAAIWWK